MDEYRKAQPLSGYPIKLPLGLKKLKSYDNPEVIQAFADILGSLMQSTDRSPVDHLKTHEFTSSLTINMLTMNHGNLTGNPKLDNKEVYNMAMKDRPIVKMMMQNSAHILCLNEADAFLSPQDENPGNSSRRSSDLGTRASLSSNGHPDQSHALSAADLPQEWNYWHGTFPQRVRIGEPHSECSDVSSEPRKIALILNTTFRPRTAWQLRDHPCSLNPRSTLDRDCHHAPLSKDTGVTKRLSFSTSSRVMSIVVCSQIHPTNHSSSLTAATQRGQTSRLLPLEFFTSIHQSVMEQHGKIFRTKSCHPRHCTNAIRSPETPTNPRIPTADSSTSSIRPTVS